MGIALAVYTKVNVSSFQRGLQFGHEYDGWVGGIAHQKKKKKTFPGKRENAPHANCDSLLMAELSLFCLLPSLLCTGRAGRREPIVSGVMLG